MGDSAKIRSDAILLLVLGRTQEELKPTGGNNGGLDLTNQLSSGFSGVVSSIGVELSNQEMVCRCGFDCWLHLFAAGGFGFGNRAILHYDRCYVLCDFG